MALVVVDNDIVITIIDEESGDKRWELLYIHISIEQISSDKKIARYLHQWSFCRLVITLMPKQM